MTLWSSRSSRRQSSKKSVPPCAFIHPVSQLISGCPLCQVFEALAAQKGVELRSFCLFSYLFLPISDAEDMFSVYPALDFDGTRVSPISKPDTHRYAQRFVFEINGTGALALCSVLDCLRSEPFPAI